VPEERIDELRAEERRDRQRPRYAFPSRYEELTRYARGDTLAARILQEKMAMLMRPVLSEMDFSALEARAMPIPSLGGRVSPPMGGRRFDTLITDEAEYIRRAVLPPPQVTPVEGNPTKPKPWHQFIEPNRRKKPR
jgi:hypothetical protein